MRSFFKLAISISLILVPVIFVFKSFFIPGPLAFGDAPFFYLQGLKELISEPLAWTNRGASFGGLNNVIFLWPLMFVYGLIDNNDIAIRVLFYFPAVIFAGLGTYLLTKYLKLSRTVGFFSVLTYVLNTYFILLIDGGQVGIALAYGLFPLSLFFVKKLVDKPTFNSFFISLIFLFLLGVADPRFVAILILTITIWQIAELKFKNLRYLIPLMFAWALLNLYWIYPLIKNSSVGNIVSISNIGIGSWYDPLILRAPHWPNNLFGKILKPPLYFGIVPILILAGVVLKRSRNVLSFLVVFIVFALLYSLNPFIYLPFGSAFRDSTKFFAPLLLFAGILIGYTAEVLNRWFFKLSIYLFILFLIYPALIGKMNFVLSSRTYSSDFQKIYENLSGEGGYFRTAWFPERHLLTYETQNNPAIDARELVHFLPFANLNASEDVFNFLNNETFVDWFRVLGIKYLVMSGNPREILKTQQDQKDWGTITSLIDRTPGLVKLDLGTDTVLFKVPETYPRAYSVKKIIGVIGQPLKSIAPSVYFEDGKLDFKRLEGINPDSVALLFNGREKSDLAMSFLQKHFVSASQAKKKEWAVYTKDQYLKYKYELLIRGVKFNDFDFRKGISFSTQKGEKLEFEFAVPKDGNYIFAVRSMTPENGDTTFKWKTTELSLKKGKHTEIIENSSDMQILNLVVLIPKADFEDAQRLAQTFTTHFEVIDIKRVSDLEGEYSELEIEKIGALKYKFNTPEDKYWLIMSDSYSPFWHLGRPVDSFPAVPVYSAINGFYVDPKWRDLRIEFGGQENVRWGIYGSVVSILVLVIIFIWKKS
ncbi:MAG: hypothetical protein AAB656_01400 [Patescibacteria group bacterium]